MPSLAIGEPEQHVSSDIAADFVDLALKHDWPKVQELSPEEVKVFFDTVTAAGLEPTKVILGRLVGHYLNDENRRSGETYPINRMNPYKVLGREGGDDYFATGWLDEALRIVQRREDHQKLIQTVRQEIQRSIPLKPIQLTVESDMLKEYPPRVNHSYFVDHTHDDSTLSSCVGVHDHCNGWMDRGRSSMTHDVLLCRSCHLRVPFSRDIKTYGELRKVLAAKYAQVHASH